MKRLKIFDLDGVLFQHPTHCIFEMAKEMPEELLWRISMEGGFFSSEMMGEEAIRPYYNAFVERYFSKRMQPENVARLEAEFRRGQLAIASLNNRGTIERHLEGSRIRRLFSVILTRDDTSDKGEMLRRACEGYDPETEVSFVTDTVDDIRIARAFCPKIDIEAVVSGIDDWRSLVGYVGEAKIIAPFY